MAAFSFQDDTFGELDVSFCDQDRRVAQYESPTDEYFLSGTPPRKTRTLCLVPFGRVCLFPTRNGHDFALLDAPSTGVFGRSDTLAEHMPMYRPNQPDARNVDLRELLIGVITECDRRAEARQVESNARADARQVAAELRAEARAAAAEMRAQARADADLHRTFQFVQAQMGGAGVVLRTHLHEIDECRSAAAFRYRQDVHASRA